MKRLRVMAIAMIAAVVTAVSALPASAQPQQQGLVNVNLNEIEIGVPVSVAANICDVNANVLAEQSKLGETVCTTTAESGAVFGPGNGQGAAKQKGLVNVNVSDVTVLVPVSVAANLCDVSVNVLAKQNKEGAAVCEAVSTSEA